MDLSPALPAQGMAHPAGALSISRYTVDSSYVLQPFRGHSEAATPAAYG